MKEFVLILFALEWNVFLDKSSYEVKVIVKFFLVSELALLVPSIFIRSGFCILLSIFSH